MAGIQSLMMFGTTADATAPETYTYNVPICYQGSCFFTMQQILLNWFQYTIITMCGAEFH